MTALFEPLVNYYYYGSLYPDELTKLEIDLLVASDDKKASIQARIEAIKERAIQSIASDFELVNPGERCKKSRRPLPKVAQTPELSGEPVDLPK